MGLKRTQPAHVTASIVKTLLSDNVEPQIVENLADRNGKVLNFKVADGKSKPHQDIEQ